MVAGDAELSLVDPWLSHANTRFLFSHDSGCEILSLQLEVCGVGLGLEAVNDYPYSSPGFLICSILTWDLSRVSYDEKAPLKT